MPDTSDNTQLEKIAYIKMIYLRERKPGVPPVYTRRIHRLNKDIEVYDEAQFLRIIKYEKPSDEVITIKDISTGSIDINVLLPWQELKFNAYFAGSTENNMTQDIVLNGSNVFCSSMYYFNGFQRGQTQYMAQMEKDTKIGRIIVDFSSIPNHQEIIIYYEPFLKRLNQSEEILPGRDVKELNGANSGIFHLKEEDLKLGDIIGLRFDVNWDKVNEEFIDAVQPTQSKKDAHSTTTILFLGANPKDSTRLRLDEEFRDIKEQLTRGKDRDGLVLQQNWAITTDELQQELLDNSPQIVHFSGHGELEGIAVEDEHGLAKVIPAKGLANLFKICSDTVQCVVLSCCFSLEQANAIAQHIPFVIGMKKEIHEQAAIKFAVGFYRGIASGRDIKKSFDIGLNAIALEGIEGADIPVLIEK